MKDAAPTTGRSTAGTILFENLTPPHVRVHRVWNIDTDTFHVMDIELLSNDSGFSEKPLPHLQIAIDTPWVRAYRFALNKGEKMELPAHNRSLLVVAFDSGAIRLQQNGIEQNKTVQPGTFFFMSPGRNISIKNIETATVHFVLLDVPN